MENVYHLWPKLALSHSKFHQHHHEDYQVSEGRGNHVCQIGCLSSFGLVSALGPLYRRLRKVDQCHHENHHHHHHHHEHDIALNIEVNVHSTRYRRVPCETNAHGPHVYEYCKVTQIWNRWPVKRSKCARKQNSGWPKVHERHYSLQAGEMWNSVQIQGANTQEVRMLKKSWG